MIQKEICWGEETSDGKYQSCVTCPISESYFNFISGKSEADPRCYPRLKERGLWTNGKPDRGMFGSGPVVGKE